MESSSVLLCLILGTNVASVSAAEPSFIHSLLLALNQRPWLLGVYVVAVGLPIILFISFMWPDKRFGPPDQPYYYKKSDDVQPDDPETSRLSRSTKISGAASRQDDTPAHKRKPQKTQMKN